MIDGKVGSMGLDNASRARGTGHPPVVRTLAVKENNGVYPVGLLVQPDGDGKMVPVTTLTKLMGVVDQTADSAATGSVQVIVHGSVRLDLLKKDASGTAPDAAEITALRKAGIYAE